MIDPSFQDVKRLFVLSFEDNAVGTGHTEYFLLKLELKDYNVMIDGRNVFVQPVRNKIRTFDSIRKIATG